MPPRSMVAFGPAVDSPRVKSAETDSVKSIRILLVDDQSSVRRGLAMRLQLEPDITVIGEAEDGNAAVAAAQTLQPDVLVMDYEMPGMDGIEATKTLTIPPSSRLLPTPASTPSSPSISPAKRCSRPSGVP